MAYKFQLGDAVMSGALIQEGTLEIADDEGSLRFSVNRDSGLISGSGNLRVVGSAHLKSTLNVSGAVVAGAGLTSTAAANSFGATSFGDASITNVNDIALDSISADGASFSFGSNWTAAGRTCADLGTVTTATSITATDLIGGNVDGILGADTARAATVTTLSLTSIASNWTNAGRTVADAGILTTVDINGGSVDGTAIGEAVQSTAKFTTISGSGQLDVRGASNLDGAVLCRQGLTSTAGANTLGATSFSDANITNVGSIALDTISADDGASFAMGSNWTNAGRTVADGGIFTTLDLNGGSIDGTTIGAAAQSSGKFTALSASGDLTIADNAIVNLTTTLHGVVTANAGVKTTTLSGSSNLDVVGNITSHGTVKFAGLANDANFARAADSLFYYDVTDGQVKQMLSSVFLTDIAGTGISVADGKLTTDAATGVIRWGNVAVTLQEGFNVATASFSQARTWTLPASPAISDVVRVKKDDSAYGLTIAGAGSQMIDGQATLLLESPSGSVSLVCVALNRWSVY
tara:strand:- start:58403 stop:59968 length:1566 start_codon:yes stop_codon:yes gene_type:complete